MRPAAALGAAAVLALSGCSTDEARPSTLPPLASGSPSASADASPAGERPATAPPTTSPGVSGASEAGHGVPPAAQPATAHGASAFARHYLSVLQQAIATADAGGLERLSDAGCGGCRNLVEAVETAGSRGERVRGGEFVVQFAEAPLPTQGEVTVDIRYLRRAGLLLGVDGELLGEFGAEGPVDAQLRLRRAGASWEVVGFRSVPS